MLYRVIVTHYRSKGRMKVSDLEGYAPYAIFPSEDAAKEAINLAVREERASFRKKNGHLNLHFQVKRDDDSVITRTPYRDKERRGYYKVLTKYFIRNVEVLDDRIDNAATLTYREFKIEATENDAYMVSNIKRDIYPPVSQQEQDLLSALRFVDNFYKEIAAPKRRRSYEEAHIKRKE